MPNGEAVSVQTVSVDHAEDFGYCLEVERLRGRVGGRDVVDEVALRTTSVFRCEDGDWKLVHRHAGPAAQPRVPESIV